MRQATRPMTTPIPESHKALSLSSLEKTWGRTCFQPSHSRCLTRLVVHPLLATASGLTLDAVMLYTSNTQVAAILPSASPIGLATLTLRYNGNSAQRSIS